jgi:hypothetical protein
MAVLALGLALALAAGSAWSAPGNSRWEGDEQPSYYAKPPGVSLEQAADRVRRETGGRVLSATPATRGGERGYSIRVLLDGKRVKQVFVDSEGNLR